MKVYNTIPSELRPPPGAAKIQYVEAFDSKFTLWLNERRSFSLAGMLKNFIYVEMNLTAAKEKGREEIEGRRNKELSRFSPSSTPEAKKKERMEAI